MCILTLMDSSSVVGVAVGQRSHFSAVAKTFHRDQRSMAETVALSPSTTPILVFFSSPLRETFALAPSVVAIASRLALGLNAIATTASCPVSRISHSPGGCDVAMFNNLTIPSKPAAGFS